MNIVKAPVTLKYIKYIKYPDESLPSACWDRSLCDDPFSISNRGNVCSLLGFFVNDFVTSVSAHFLELQFVFLYECKSRYLVSCFLHFST